MMRLASASVCLGLLAVFGIGSPLNKRILALADTEVRRPHRSAKAKVEVLTGLLGLDAASF